MSKFYEATVAFEEETDTGKIKKIKERYLVTDATSVSGAEARINEELKDSIATFEVVSVKESRIVKTIKSQIEDASDVSEVE